MFYRVIKQHPDLDAVILGAGIQRGIDFSKPESIDLKSVQEELTTNYLSHVSLVKYLLPHLKSLSRAHPTALIFISSGLALLPMLRCGNYCASKAAIHQLIMTMREQLRPHIKVIEILPAAVQTELHDEKNQPEIKNGREWGMPIDEFLTEAWLGLELGQEAIPVGMTQEAWDAFEGRRVALFQGTMKQLRDPKYCGMTGEMETWIGRNISSE
jgi:short-subunit dehydrogenase involved in D-alanine esterification of teichoic acids